MIKSEKLYLDSGSEVTTFTSPRPPRVRTVDDLRGLGEARAAGSSAQDEDDRGTDRMDRMRDDEGSAACRERRAAFEWRGHSPWLSV